MSRVHIGQAQYLFVLYCTSILSSLFYKQIVYFYIVILTFHLYMHEKQKSNTFNQWHGIIIIRMLKSYWDQLI